MLFLICFVSLILRVSSWHLINDIILQAVDRLFDICLLLFAVGESFMSKQRSSKERNKSENFIGKLEAVYLYAIGPNASHLATECYDHFAMPLSRYETESRQILSRTEASTEISHTMVLRCVVQSPEKS